MRAKRRLRKELISPASAATHRSRSTTACRWLRGPWSQSDQQPYSSFASPYANRPIQAKLTAAATTKAAGGQARCHKTDGTLGESFLLIVVTSGPSIPSRSKRPRPGPITSQHCQAARRLLQKDDDALWITSVLGTPRRREAAAAVNCAAACCACAGCGSVLGNSRGFAKTVLTGPKLIMAKASEKFWG